MTRVKSLASVRHKKIKSQARGFVAARRKRVKVAKEALLHAGQYAYAGRRLKRRDLRSLWITRLNAALRENGTTYSVFMAKLKKNKIDLDRKVLSDMAVNNPEVFAKIVTEVK